MEKKTNYIYKGEEAISLNVESKSGNDFVKTKNIENVLHCKNITDNKKIRKGKKKLWRCSFK